MGLARPEAPTRLFSLREIVPFLGLALLVMGGLLAPGYILTGDLIFGPATLQNSFHRHFLGTGFNLQATGPAPLARALLSGLEYVLSLALPVQVIEKLLFLLILTLSGVAMFRLVPSSRLYPRYFAGFLYMVNPYTYERFLAGHLNVLWGYALLPLAILACWRALEHPSFARGLLAGLWLSLVAISDHILPMAWALFALLSCLYLPDKKRRWARLGVFSLSLAFFLAINAPWVIFTLMGQSSQVQQIREIGRADLELFAPAADSNLFFNLAALYGFWRGGFYYVKDHLPAWQALWVAIVFLVFLGLAKGLRQGPRAISLVLLLAGLGSLYLAAGSAHSLSSPVFDFLYERLTLFKGYREPQKFIALLALSYAFFSGLGVDWLAAYARRGYHLLLGLILLLPLAYTYPMFLGFGFQIEPKDYPQEYYQAIQIVEAERAGAAVLVLPWHQYMKVSWIDRPIPNPGGALFHQPAILGDNIEIKGVYSLSTNPVSRYVEGLLQEGDHLHNMGHRLASLGVKYVILLKEMDYSRYAFLDRQADLQLVLDTPLLAIYRNLDYSAEGKTPPAPEPGLAAALSSWEKSPPLWPGYAVSGLFLLGGLTYLLSRGRD